MHSIRRMSLAGAALALLLQAGPAAAGQTPVQHAGGSSHKVVDLTYHPDDICGPRSGWTETTVTSQWKYTELPDGSFNFVFVETGTYHTDFDDPAIPSYDSQFTGTQHGTITHGGTSISTSQWHDFPGTITIFEQILFVQVGDVVKLDRDDLRVDGCP